MQILRDVYKDGSWSAPDMILELADEEQNRDENQRKRSFSDTQQEKATDQFFTFRPENQADGLGILQSRKRAKKQHFTTTIQSGITYVVVPFPLTLKGDFSIVLSIKSNVLSHIDNHHR